MIQFVQGQMASEEQSWDPNLGEFEQLGGNFSTCSGNLFEAMTICMQKVCTV